MSITVSARRTLIRIGKVLPFLLCFLVLISCIENIYAIVDNKCIINNDYIIYNTPISFSIALRMEYDILLMLVVSITSVAIEACRYNLLAVTFLWFNICQRYILWEYGAFDDSIYLVIMFLNVAFLTWVIYKGTTSIQ